MQDETEKAINQTHLCALSAYRNSTLLLFFSQRDRLAPGAAVFRLPYEVLNKESVD